MTFNLFAHNLKTVHQTYVELYFFFLVPYDYWNTLGLLLTRYKQCWNLTLCTGGHFYIMQVKHISATGILEDFYWAILGASRKSMVKKTPLLAISSLTFANFLVLQLILALTEKFFQWMKLITDMIDISYTLYFLTIHV